MKKPFILIGLINALLIVIPFISAIALLLRRDFYMVGVGLVFMFLLPQIYSASFLIEKKVFSKLISIGKIALLAKILPIYYCLFVGVYILVCWFAVNSHFPGNFLVFLWSVSVEYVPFNYILQAEQAHSGKVNTMTNVINNYAVIGSFIFSILANFTRLPLLVPLIALAAVAMIITNGLDHRLMRDFTEPGDSA